jgi:hypothetical protein
MEGDFLIYPSDVDEEGGGKEDIAFSVGGLINVADSDGYGKTFSGEVIFSDEGPVDAGDFCTAVYES